jgi:phenylpyruvate tautomerase PptA (4-oxalocrotonate tautomerase family)
MKKITITVSEEVHSELLKVQLEKRLKEKKKTSLAEVVSEVLHDFLVVQKATPTK